jgi:hypothetical protein
MEGVPRWASLSDISQASATATESTAGELRQHRSLLDISGRTPLPVEELLDNGSPFSHGSPDTALLDEDSDGQLDQNTVENTDECTVTPMAVEENVRTNQSASDPLYHQCKTSRRTSFVEKLVSVSSDGTFGSCVSSQSTPVGNLTDGVGLQQTFHGSRIREGNMVVNQSISVSFDPGKLVCVTCNAEHNIIGKTPVTLFFSDQNFIASMEGPMNSCLNIVRMEDASLSDLCKLSREMLGNLRLPEGSVLLFGSASFLSRVGTSVYAREWLSVVSSTEATWPGVRVCPLIPLIQSDCTGTLAREISEIAAWFSIVYENNPTGMLEPWTAAVTALAGLTIGSVSLPSMDTYKLPLPTSLSEPSQAGSMTFCATSSRPVTLKGLPKDTLCELVSTLLKTIHRDFQSCLHPEHLLVREPQMVETDTGPQKVILLGASNLSRCAGRLRELGLRVIDLTQPGWIASPENIAILKDKLSKISCGASDKIVFDLFGNVSYRFEQFDGTLSLAYKSGGRYHMAGNVVTCPLVVFRKMLDNTASLFRAKNGSSLIVVPPLPRYMFAGCCKQPSHCPNVAGVEHAKKILSDVIGLRTCLKKFLAGLGLAHCRVLDTCCIADCIPTATVDIRVEALKAAMAADGVHLTDMGYDLMVKSIVQLSAKPTSTTHSDAPSGTSKMHYWRGFRSPVGSVVNLPSSNWTSRGRGAQARGAQARACPHRDNRQYHPYRRH